MVGGWHRPSDVVAAVLVVTAWTGVAVALGAHSRPRSGEDTGTAAALVAGGLLLVGVAAGVGAFLALERSLRHVRDGLDLASRADLLTAYGGGTLGVISVTAVCFALMLWVVRVGEPRVRRVDAPVGFRAPRG
jgi:hypothetical protein